MFDITPRISGFPISFMHVPKTAGTALHVALRDGIRPSKPVYGLDRSLFGGFDGFDTVEESLRAAIYLDPQRHVPDPDFIAGHMALSTLSRICMTAQYVTVLREPHSRLLSHWIYWRTQTEDHLSPWGDWADHVRRARRPLEEFLSCPDVACQSDNLMVRMLLWPHRLVPNDGFIDPQSDDALVDEAINKLNEFSFVDIVENPKLSANIQSWMGQELTYAHLNGTPSVPARFRSPLDLELTAAALDLLEARSRLDVKLWQAVSRRRVLSPDPEALGRRAIMMNIARHAGLMIGQDA